MSYINSILRIIEGTQNNDINKVINYSKKLLASEEVELDEDEYDEAIKCIKERFDPNAGKAVMDEKDLNKLAEDCRKIAISAPEHLFNKNPNAKPWIFGYDKTLIYEEGFKDGYRKAKEV